MILDLSNDSRVMLNDYLSSRTSIKVPAIDEDVSTEYVLSLLGYLRSTPDGLFPRGKSATIQYVELQLFKAENGI